MNTLAALSLGGLLPTVRKELLTCTILNSLEPHPQIFPPLISEQPTTMELDSHHQQSLARTPNGSSSNLGNSIQKPLSSSFDLHSATASRVSLAVVEADPFPNAVSLNLNRGGRGGVHSKPSTSNTATSSNTTSSEEITHKVCSPSHLLLNDFDNLSMEEFDSILKAKEARKRGLLASERLQL